MQKKVLAALSAAALSAGLSMSVLAATADSVNNPVQIKFIGKIVDTACEIGTDAADNTVQLGTYPTVFFNKQDAETDKVGFNITIGKCRLTDAGTGYDENMGFPVDRVKLTFKDDGTEGFERTNRDGIMFLTPSGTDMADNVGIRVQYKSKQGFVDVFGAGAETQPIAVSETAWKETKSGTETGKDGEQILLPEEFEYAIPMQANIARVNQEAVGSGDVFGQMTVTLSYE